MSHILDFLNLRERLASLSEFRPDLYMFSNTEN